MSDLLHAIWSGRVRPCARPAPARLGKLSKLHLPPDTVFLQDASSRGLQVLEASWTLESDLTLADVLAEEFEMFIGPFVLVVVVPHSAPSPTPKPWTKASQPHVLVHPAIEPAHVHQL